MLVFKKLDLSDIKTLKPYFLLSGNNACDNTVGGTFIWRDYFCTEYALYKDNLIIKAKIFDNTTAFSMPLGKKTEDMEDSLRQIEFYCKETGIPMTICMATAEDVETIESIYNNVSKTPERDWSDYVYKASDLANLPGRKYSGQRNHINYFKRTFPDFCVKRIDSGNIGDVRKFFEEYNSKFWKDSPALDEERKKIFEVLENFHMYGQTGIALYIGNIVAGFAIGEIISGTLFVHIEKANSEYRGAYQMIVNEFVKQHMNDNIIYVNREDDAGDENLRISKMSYHPYTIIEKYTVEINEMA